MEGNELLQLLMNQSPDVGTASVEQEIVPDGALEEMAQRKKDYEKESLMSLIAGGVGEALMGEVGGGAVADYGSKLASQRLGKADEMGSVMDKMRIKASTKSSANQFKPQLRLAYDENGRPVYKYFHGAGTKAIDTGEEAAFAPKVIKDRNEEPVLLQRREGAKPTSILDKPSGEALSIRARKKMDSVLAKFNSEVKNNDSNIKDLTLALKNINEGEFGAKAAFMGIVKTIETRLSDLDRDFYQDPYSRIRALRESASRLSNKQYQEIKEELLKEARAVLQNSLESSKTFHEAKRQKYAKQLSKDQAIGFDRALDELGGSVFMGEKLRKGKKQKIKLEQIDSKSLMNLSDDELNELAKEHGVK